MVVVDGCGGCRERYLDWLEGIDGEGGGVGAGEGVGIVGIEFVDRRLGGVAVGAVG